MLEGWRAPAEHQARARELHDAWDKEVQRIYDIRHAPLPSQGEIIGAVNTLSDPNGVIINAAGSLPGDLHKLWRARNPKNYHLEYGYSTMGYEIAGGLGVKMADPSREVTVMVGDGSYLMLAQEIVTSVQEGYKLIIVLVDNSGFKSIGGLSRSLGQGGFGTRYIYPTHGYLAGDEVKDDVEELPVDLAANARSLGAAVFECKTYDDFVRAYQAAKHTEVTTVVYIRCDRYESVPGYDSWWDVPVAEVSEMPPVQDARKAWEAMRAKERIF